MIKYSSCLKNLSLGNTKRIRSTHNLNSTKEYQFTENNDVGNWLILLFEHCTNRIFNSLRILFYSSVDRVNIQNYWFFFLIYVSLKHRASTITNFKSPESVVWQKPPPTPNNCDILSVADINSFNSPVKC